MRQVAHGDAVRLEHVPVLLRERRGEDLLVAALQHPQRQC